MRRELARGGMSAVLGLDAAQVRDVLRQCSARTSAAFPLANFNSPTQIVISGDLDAVQAAASRCSRPAPSASSRSTYRAHGTAS